LIFERKKMPCFQAGKMIAAVDVSYDSSPAYAAAVVFCDWSSSSPASIYRKKALISSDYIPGRFRIPTMIRVADAESKAASKNSAI